MLCYDEELYKEAINQLDNFCLDILDDLSDFAIKNDYDREWVFDKFKERLFKFKSAYIRGDMD
jgi:hypothetical protein|nr:MAG TPA: hypothetical protein [Caudoviricetes sp.]